ncbi:MAG: hypothetical protein [Microviridae sp.]|nr:MAG: hypothetical protein [Microviridae sp.]
MKNVYVIRDEVSGECGDFFCLPSDAVLSRSLASTVAMVDDVEILARMRDSVVYQIAVTGESDSGLPYIEMLPAPRLAFRVSNSFSLSKEAKSDA